MRWCTVTTVYNTIWRKPRGNEKVEHTSDWNHRSHPYLAVTERRATRCLLWVLFCRKWTMSSAYFPVNQALGMQTYQKAIFQYILFPQALPTEIMGYSKTNFQHSARPEFGVSLKIGILNFIMDLEIFKPSPCPTQTVCPVTEFWDNCVMTMQHITTSKLKSAGMTHFTKGSEFTT